VHGGYTVHGRENVAGRVFDGYPIVFQPLLVRNGRWIPFECLPCILKTSHLRPELWIKRLRIGGSEIRVLPTREERIPVRQECNERVEFGYCPLLPNYVADCHNLNSILAVKSVQHLCVVCP